MPYFYIGRLKSVALSKVRKWLVKLWVDLNNELGRKRNIKELPLVIQ